MSDMQKFFSLSTLNVVAPGVVAKAERTYEKMKTMSGEFNNIATRIFDNGMRGQFKKIKDDKNFNLSVTISAGQNADPGGKPGVAHFLEHMIFFQNEETIDNFFSELQKRGGYMHGATSPDRTTYQFSIPHSADNANWLCKIVSEAMFNPSFDRTQIEVEKEVITNEYYDGVDGRARASGPEMMAVGLQKAAFNNPYFDPEKGLGTPEDIAAITLEDIEDFHARHYIAGRTDIEIAGPLSWKEAYGYMHDNFAHVAPRAGEDIVAPALPYKGGHLDLGEQGLTQARYAIGLSLPGQPYDKKGSATSSVLSEYITLALHDTFRGKGRRTLYNNSVLLTGGAYNSRMLEIYGSIRPDNADTVLPAISNVLNDIAGGVFDPDRLAAAKARVDSALVDHENDKKHEHDNFESPLEIKVNKFFMRRRVARVTAPELAAMADEMLTGKPPTLVTAGQTGKMQSYEEFAAMIGAPTPARHDLAARIEKLGQAPPPAAPAA